MMVVSAKIHKQLVEACGGLVLVVQHSLLVAGQRTGEKVAATGGHHVYLFTQIHLELFKPSLGLLDRQLSLQGNDSNSIFKGVRENS